MLDLSNQLQPNFEVTSDCERLQKLFYPSTLHLQSKTSVSWYNPPFKSPRVLNLFIHRCSNTIIENIYFIWYLYQKQPKFMLLLSQLYNSISLFLIIFCYFNLFVLKVNLNISDHMIQAPFNSLINFMVLFHWPGR